MENTELIHELISTIKLRSKALIERDVKSLDNLLSSEFIYTNANGEVFDKELYINRFAMNPEVIWISQDVIEYKIRMQNNYVAFIAKIHDVAKLGNTYLDNEFRTTQLYEATATGWKYIVGHTSNIVT